MSGGLPSDAGAAHSYGADMMFFAKPSPWRSVLAALLTLTALSACGSDGTTDGETADAPLNISIDEASSDDDTAGPAESDDDDSSTAETATDGSDENGELDEADATEDTPNPLQGGSIATEGERSVWTGTIDGRIGFSLWLTEHEDMVRGELTYDTVGEPITVHGRSYPSGDGWLLREFGDDGRVSGTLILGSVADGVVSDATWGDLDMALTFDRIDPTPTFFDPLVRPGHYEYSFAPFPGDAVCCGATGSLRITDVTSDAVTIAFENSTGGPAYNLAIIDSTTVALDGNVARYELSGEAVDCAFDVTVFDGYAHVRHVDDRFDCLFGNAAGVEGIYLLTEQFVSEDESPFAGDAVLTADSFGGVELGITWAELTENFGAPAYDPATADEISEGCNYVRIAGDPWSPWFMMLGDGEQSVVSRIETVREDQQTAEGVGLGSTIDDVRAAYPGQLQEDEHYYLGPDGRYLTVTPAGDAESTILFETDPDGVVVAMRNGFLDPVRWIEGCA